MTIAPDRCFGAGQAVQQHQYVAGGQLEAHPASLDLCSDQPPLLKAGDVLGHALRAHTSLLSQLARIGASTRPQHLEHCKPDGMVKCGGRSVDPIGVKGKIVHDQNVHASVERTLEVKCRAARVGA